MRTETIKEKVKFLKKHSDAYIKDVHMYMVNTNWTWHKSDLPPTEEEIKNFLFSLLDELDSNTTYLSSGGFTVFVNDEQHRIECDFGGDFMKKAGIKLVSDEKGNAIYDFINVLCADFPILDRDNLLQRYSHLI